MNQASVIVSIVLSSSPGSIITRISHIQHKTNSLHDHQYHLFAPIFYDPSPHKGRQQTLSHQHAMEGLVGGERRNSEITEVYYGSHSRPPTEVDWTSGNQSIEEGSDVEDRVANESTGLLAGKSTNHKNDETANHREGTTSFLSEIPAILVTLLINLMAAIPFGVSYFPLGWSNSSESDNDYDESDGSGIHGPFPIAGKEALGIRMFLLATITGQIVLAFCSKFQSPVSSQLIENVPFYHALAGIVIAEQGYGKEALSTLFFLMGLSSVFTGILFWGLGAAGLGKALHYFPSHVLVGFIGGIGVFITISSVGVLTGHELRFTKEGLGQLLLDFGQLAPTLCFEIVLRTLMVVLTDKAGQPLFGLLVPFFFLSIVPIFYGGLFVIGISTEEATNWGYFFPSPAPENSVKTLDSVHRSFLDSQVLDVFRVVDFSTISWRAVVKSLGTVLGLACFSVANVPINIPAFANTCKVDVDMNNELIAHGYSNILNGLLGGIQNVMTYSISVLFYKSGGTSRAAQMALILGMVVFFVAGVDIIPYIPKCMAGTLLLHIGVDLFVEGVCNSIEEYDKIEYGGVGSTQLLSKKQWSCYCI